MARPRISEEKYKLAFDKMLADNNNDLTKLSPFLLQKIVGGRMENVNIIYSELFNTVAREQEKERELIPKPEWYVDEAKEAGQAVEQLILDKWADLSKNLDEYRRGVEAAFEQKEVGYQCQIETLTSHNKQASQRIHELEETEETLDNLMETHARAEKDNAALLIRLEESQKREKALEQLRDALASERDLALKAQSELSGQLDTTQQELKKAQDQADQQQTENGKLTKMQTDLTSQISKLQKTNATLDDEKQTFSRRSENLTLQINHKDTLLKESQQAYQKTLNLREKIAGMTSTLVARDEQVEELRMELKDTRLQNKLLIERVSLQEHTK